MVRLVHTALHWQPPVEKTKDYQFKRRQEEEARGGGVGSQEVIAESRNEMMASQFIMDAPNKLNQIKWNDN